jgi:orotate phosphoribosyltransferase
MENNYQLKVAEILINIESVKFSFDDPFTLTSGLKSPVYVDCRKIISYVNERTIILNYAIKYFKENNIEFDLLAGGETAGIPYAAFFSELLKKPMLYIRKKPKGFGKNQQIEGNYEKNQKVILIEDLATDGGSKIIFLNALKNTDLRISDIFVIFYYDIFDIKKTPLRSLNIKIHSLCTWKNIVELIKLKKLYSKKQIKNLEDFLEDPEQWRSKLKKI